MMADTAKLRVAMFDLPRNLTEDVFSAFEALLNAGKAEMEVELYGCRFRLGVLEEWESREIWSKYAGSTNLVAVERMRKIDVLTQAILEITNDKGEKRQFRESDDKVLLRSMLLRLSPAVINDLYNAYLYMEAKAEKTLRETFPSFEEVAVQGFFPAGLEGDQGSGSQNEGGDEGLVN
jgi:hypothetical protein